MSLTAHVGGNAVPFKFRELLTTEQLGVYLQKSSEAARKWLRRHPEIPAVKCGREWRVDKRDVDLAMKHEAERTRKAS